MSETTLAAAVVASDTSITVSSVTDLVGSVRTPPYRVAINAEEMTVTADAGGGVLSVERDQNSPLDIYASDPFERSEDVGTSWFFADDGVSYWQGADSTADSDFSVSSGKGILAILTAGIGETPAFITSNPLTDYQVRFRFASDVLDVNVDAYLRTGVDPSQNAYRARLTIDGAGALGLRLAKNVASVATNLAASVTPAGGPYVASEEWTLAFQASGSGTTSLAAKAWRTSDGEPASWQTTTTDTEAVLQGANHSGLRYRAVSSTGTLEVQEYIVTLIPIGTSHANGDRVVLIEEWPYASDMVTGKGAPTANPPTGTKYLDIEAVPPVLYVRVGADWFTVTLT